MVFVVDALAGWLVGLLADAGRKKLTTLVLGDAQERALQQAAIAAVQDTTAELSPSDDQRAGQIAMVIREVFRAPVPDAPLAGAATLVEGLQAGIAGQLAVLDDAGLTGTWQSSAEVLGVPGTVLADRLTGHLVREIMLRGSRGGPLTPLADQLNHDLTHLQVRRVEVQGQRVEGMLARLADEVRDALGRPGSGAAAAGRPLEEVTDPFALEVHRPVQPEDAPPGLPALPAYVPREHDTALGRVVEAGAEGRSRIAVLVGGSSTGKTRACWEALQLLRDQEPGWRLWHPIDPSRPDAALRELPAIGPRTVVWLNEAQFYLDVADGGLGERVAAGLRELLRDPARAPVLVLATLWPQFWDGLTARPAGGADPHAQARELLAGHDITVPAAFTAPQLQRLSNAGDARLALAATAARDGQVIQFLAGAPELLARYRNAPPAAAALINAAMDARRLGTGIGLPQAFLAAAVPGYLTGTEWDQLDDDWLEQALAYATRPGNGIPGPLTRIRPRNSGPRHAEGTAGTDHDGMSLYRLADYLDQHGRRHRHALIPPPSFWTAAPRAQPADLTTLAAAGRARGLSQAAAQLLKSTVARGDPRAGANIIAILHGLHPGDHRPAQWVTVDVALDLDNPFDVVDLLRSLREAGAQDQVTALAGRAAAHIPLDNPHGVAFLLRDLREAGAQDQVTALAGRAAAHIPLDDPFDVASLLDGLREAGAQDQVTALLARDPAAHVALDDPGTVAGLLYDLREAGAQDQVTALAERAAAHIPLDNPTAVAFLLDGLREAGAQDQVTTLLARDPAAHIPLDNPDGVAFLLRVLREAGAQDQVTALAERAAHVALDDPRGVARLLDGLREAGAQDQATALAERAAAHIPLDDPHDVARLLPSLREAGAQDQVTALLARDPAAHVALDDPGAVAWLLRSLREAGAQDQVTALLARDPAAHVALDDPGTVAELLDGLREAGAQDQVTALAERAAHVALAERAARVALYDPGAVAWLLRSLREAGAEEQVTLLVDRLPGEGLFDLFCAQGNHQALYRFGRNPDGSPAGPWDWEDLN